MQLHKATSRSEHETSRTSNASRAIKIACPENWSQTQGCLHSNLPIEMPVDHLIELNALIPNRLEMELGKKGELPLKPLGLEKIRPDLG